LKHDPFIRATYALSDSVGTTLSPYGVVILVRKSIPIFNLEVHHISTAMARRYVSAEIGCQDGQRIHIGTVHMESLDYNKAARIQQIQEIFGPPKGRENGNGDETGIIKKSEACAAIVTGDFNFDPGIAHLHQHLQFAYVPHY
jgi:endonuclease/exonuclease/phosphatase family metal-dependent hydrolase